MDRFSWDRIADNLQNHPLPVLIVFIVTVLTGAFAAISLIQDNNTYRDQSVGAKTSEAISMQQLHVQQLIATKQSEYIEQRNNPSATILPNAIILATDISLFQATQTVLAAIQTPEPVNTNRVASTVISRYTDTPSFPTVEAFQEITLAEVTTSTFFGGQMYITLLSSSRSKGEVVVNLYTPGFPDVTLNPIVIGDKYQFHSTGVFEVQFLGFRNYDDSATFRVTYLGGTGQDSQVVGDPQIKTVSVSDTSSFFNDSLTITLKNSSSSENLITLVASAPGKDNQIYDNRTIGSILLFQGKDSFEIRPLKFEGFGSNVTLMVTKLKP